MNSPETHIHIHLVSILAIVLIASYFLTKKFFKSSASEKLFKFITKHIFRLSLGIWICGVILYTIGMYDLEYAGTITHPEPLFDTPANTPWEILIHWLAVVPRAIIASFKMFVVMHDLARVSPDLRHNILYMAGISVTHFAAAFLTFIYIIQIIGFTVKSSWELRNHAKKNLNNVHVFWDINEASCLLAESIRNHKDHKDDSIIFIAVDDSECECNAPKRTTLSSITESFTIKGSRLKRLKDINAHVAHCYDGPASISKTSNILKELKLQTISDIVEHSKKTNFYFLSDDETQNLTGALNLFDDKTLAEYKVDINIFIHARKSADNEIFDHYSQYADKADDKLKLKIIDSAYLSVQSLKQRPDALPVNFVDIDTSTGLVHSDFTALIVGFGATGQEAFKFLYEFSTFIGPDRKKTPFKCYAIDQNMDKMAGLIRQKMPLITHTELSLNHAAVDSEPFWELVRNTVHHLHYIVIALNDDILGLNLSVNLFKYALQARNADSPKLRIMLRCYNRKYENKMTDVINKLNASTEGQNISIALFGTEEKDIYTAKTILSDNVLSEAKEFHWVYEDKKTKTPEEQWQIDFEGENAIDYHQGKPENPTRFHAIFDINRKISQDIANSLHKTTKQTLLGTNETEIENLVNIVNTRQKFTTVYKCDDNQIKTKLENLAITEHERWMSAHKLMGFTYGDKKNYAKKQTPNMVPYSELPEINKSFDCNVVDTTIKLLQKNEK